MLRGQWAALPLVALAGCVDAIGWLRLDEMFIGVITGNSTLLGVAWSGGDWLRSLELAKLVGLFALGAALGEVLGRLAGSWRAPVVLGAVTALLAAGAALPFEGPDSLAILALVPAMGMVNTALPHAASITFLTGTLVRSMQGLVGALLGAAPRWGWLPQAAAWVALVAGALLGAALHVWIGSRALAVPAAMAAMVALLALRDARRA